MDRIAGLHEQHERESSPTRPMNRYKVTIGGESYFLVSDDPEEHVRAVARFVDDQMRALGNAGLTDDPKRMAVLVALQCASKMVASNAVVEGYQLHNEKLLGFITEEVSRLSDA